MEFMAFCTIVMLAVGGVAVILFVWELVSQLVKYRKEKRLERSEEARMIERAKGIEKAEREREKEREREREREREKRRVANDWWKEFNRSCRKSAREYRAKVREGKRLERKGRAVAKRNERFRRKFLE